MYITFVDIYFTILNLCSLSCWDSCKVLTTLWSITKDDERALAHHLHVWWQTEPWDIKLRKLGTNMLSRCRYGQKKRYTCRTWPWSNEHMGESRICLGVYRYFILRNEEMGQKYENQEYLYSWGRLGWKYISRVFVDIDLTPHVPKIHHFAWCGYQVSALFVFSCCMSQNSLPPHALEGVDKFGSVV